MSVLVADLITRASRRIADPAASRITRDLWLQFYNETLLDITTELKVLETDATFQIEAAVSRYAYPEDAVVMKKLQYTDTPTDTGSYAYLDEKFEDEFRLMTNRHYPQGAVWGYIARPEFFQVLGEPTVQVAAGGMITYQRTAAWVAVEASAVLELPYLFATFVVDGMLYRAKYVLQRYQEGEADEKRWMKRLEAMRDKMEDRSDDRRPAIRPPEQRNPYRGMR